MPVVEYTLRRHLEVIETELTLWRFECAIDIQPPT